MNIISKIDCHEMRKRWVIGEVNSEFFNCKDQAQRKETFLLLESEDPLEQKKGIDIFLQKSNRRQLFKTFPESTEWFLASLHVVEDEFNKLKTMNYPKWNEFSGGSYLLINAARYLTDNLGIDKRIRSITRGLPHKKIELRGITFMSEAKEGPYVVAEGHARLVSIYHNCIIKKIKLFESNELEVVLGVSKQRWCLSPPNRF